MKLQIFLPLATYPDANSDAVAGNAIAVAAQLGAGLHVLALQAKIPQVSSALSHLLLNVPERIREAEARSRQSGDELLAKILEEGARQGIALTTTVESIPLALQGEVAVSHARYFDLAVVGWEAANSTARMIAEALIFGSGRPVVLLPDSVGVKSIDHVAIAWDGSRVATRAVADAMPFLARASKVHVLTVVDEKPLKPSEDGERLAALLCTRGVIADAAAIHAEDCPIALTLQDRATEIGADLLVMGGYGHSRIRDFVLGGATEGVLADLRLPVLMSH